MPSPSPIDARPLLSTSHTAGTTTLYHDRYQGFVARPHAHDHLQVLIPLAGRLSLAAGGRNQLIGPEQAALIAPGAVHGFTFIDGVVDYLAINTDVAWLQDALAPWTGSSLSLSDIRVVRHLGLWLQARLLADDLDGQEAGLAAVVGAGLTQIGIYLARAVSATATEEAATDPRIVRAVERMLREFDCELGVADLAAEAAMSPRHFERCFKAVMGNSPKQFLLEVRITAAKELLTTTALPVARVGMQVGFANPSHFSDTFQKLVGQPPSAYRLQSASP